MDPAQELPKTGRRAQNAVLLALVGVGGVAAAAFSLRTPSEAGAAILFGYSFFRLAVALGALLGGGLFITAAVAEYFRPAKGRRLSEKVGRIFAVGPCLFALTCLFFLTFLILAATLILAVSPVSLELTQLKTLRSHLGWVLIWIELTLVLLTAFVFLNTGLQTGWRAFFTPLRLAILFSGASVVYVAALKIYMTYTWDIRMRRLEEYFFLPALAFIAWGLLDTFFRGRAWYPKVLRWVQLLALAAVTYTIYRHTAQWMEWQNTPAKSYWQDLANAFLHGQLYLTNPASTHDLTLYKGNWYVPNPPLPALVLLPVVAIWGVNINMVLFSILAGVSNVVLVFCLLEEAARQGIVPTRRAANLLITAVFALGTTHWWLSIMGQMWFLSQVLALTCALAAALLVLRRASPWLVGALLGLALLSRPNMFTLWPFLVGLAVYIIRQAGGRFEMRRVITWAAQSAVPVVFSVAALLFYNYVRFDNFFDFGYETINGAEWLVQAVQTYGMFNVHFVPSNFNVMFLKMPYIEMRGNCFYFSPTREGFSMLAMTPALVYVFRRLKWNWWTAGAWASVILSVALLMLYHNNGAWQPGYRYLMDFITPVLLLLAVGVGQRASWIFKFLALASFLISGASILWWFEKWWC